MHVKMCIGDVHRMPGFNTVVLACKAYRLALSQGKVKLPPRESYVAEHLPWLNA